MTDIATLNDNFRKSFIGGEVLLSAGIAAMSSEDKANIVSLVQNFDICEQYAPSLATLFTLIDNIGLISSIDKHSTTAKQLYEQGLSLIKQKLLQ